MDGFFFFKIDGDGVAFDEGQPAIGFYEQAMSFDHAVTDPKGSVIEVGVVINRGVLMAVPGHFDAAGGIPGLLDDNGVIGGATGVVVENDRIREAGGDNDLATERIILRLRRWLLTVKEEQNSEDQEEDGEGEPEASKGSGRSAVGAFLRAFREVCAAFGRQSFRFGRIFGKFGMRISRIRPRRRRYLSVLHSQIPPIIIAQVLGEGV